MELGTLNEWTEAYERWAQKTENIYGLPVNRKHLQVLQLKQSKDYLFRRSNRKKTNDK